MATPILNIEVDASDLDDILSGSALEGKAAEAISQSTAILLNRIRERFLAQTDPDGVAWVPSKAALLREKQNRGGGTLYDTGNLFHSIQLYSVSPLEQAIGTDVPYGQYHQFGTQRLPVREFLGFSKDDEELVLAVMVRKIKELFP
jgi:phage virion morphogenesis protein